MFAFLGYLRENFFVYLNLIMYEKYYHSSSAVQIPQVMRMFEDFNYNYLYYFKYIFTIFWVLIFFAANYLALKKLTTQAVFSKILQYSYLLMLALAMLSMSYGYFLNGRLQDDEYTLSRWLMGIAQSPIICLILLASEKLLVQSDNLDRNEHTKDANS